ncbi:MAG: T9SS type A sorting domain-containing protein [Flavobacteriales bacterium]|nr:T9SS type A sorting domain-containing protein [Flavobacteriales bacterium]
MKPILPTLFFVMIQIGLFAQPCKTVIGYYPNWQWFDRSGLVGPNTIHYEDYSILNYSFFAPQEDGSVRITDPWADKNLLLGQFNWSVAPAGYDTEWDFGNPAYHYTNTSLISKAHEAGTKVLICIGGWTLSDMFPGIAADQMKRTQFAHSCCEVIRTYGCDGIDIDWEYPGFTEHSGTPQDEANYSMLITELRDSLDDLEQTLGNTLLLTAAFGASTTHMENIEWGVMVSELDFINLMSYDFSGAWDTETNHHTALYASGNSNPEYCVSFAVNKLVNDYDVPSDMINVGVAFYGKSIVTTGSPELQVPSAGYADGVTFSLDEGVPMYYNILQQMDLFSYHWDDEAQAAYLTGLNGLNTFVTYDDENSVLAKADFILDQNLAGAIIWEITGDYVESTPGSGTIAATPLSDALNEGLCQSASVNLDCDNMCVTSIAMNAEGGMLDITIENGNIQINYPIVMVVLNGDTVANIAEEFFFFAQLEGQTVIHTVPTTLTSIPVDFSCEVIVADGSNQEECTLSYPCLPIHVEVLQNDLSIYPVPGNNVLNVSNRSEVFVAKIYDTRGRMLQSVLPQSTSFTLDISKLESGVYFLHCEESVGEPVVYRFVVD